MRFQPAMTIQLHKKDIDLLNKIRGYFENVGFITIGEKLASFRVQSIKEISENIIPRAHGPAESLDTIIIYIMMSSRLSVAKLARSHFDKYPLITQKQADRARAQYEISGPVQHARYAGCAGYLLFREIIPRGIGSYCLASKGGELVPSGEQEQKYPFLDPTPKGVGSTPSGLDP